MMRRKRKEGRRNAKRKGRRMVTWLRRGVTGNSGVCTEEKREKRKKEWERKKERWKSSLEREEKNRSTYT